MSQRPPSEPPCEPEADLRTRLNGETSKIAWNELQKFYAKGRVIGVATEQDLIEIACEVSRDNKEVVEQWLQTGVIFQVDDQMARKWHENKSTHWAVVIAPWVLVQELRD
jgi:hypothetical protein